MHPDRTRKKAKKKTQLISVIAHSRFLFLSTDFGKLTRDLRLFRVKKKPNGESVIALIFMQFSFFDEPVQPNRIQSQESQNLAENHQKTTQAQEQPVYQADPMSVESEKIDKNNALAMFKVNPFSL